MINIYDIDGTVLLQAELTSSATRTEEMSKSDYVQLSFDDCKKVILPVGAYIDVTYNVSSTRTETRQFLLLEVYEPTQSDEQSWKYTPEFQHPKMILGKIPFYINTRNSKNEEIHQTNWSFYGTPQTIMQKVCDFLNKDIQFGNCGWTANIANTTANTLDVSFSDVDLLSALTNIANALDDNSEWHIDYDNEVIYLGKVCIGSTPLELIVGTNVAPPSLNNSSEKYYNQYTVLGGSRNISQVNDKGDNVASGDIRLQLESGKTGTIVFGNGETRTYTTDNFSTMDLRKENEQAMVSVLEFSDIYPSLETYVYNVRGRQKYVIDSETNEKIPASYNEDGSVKTYKTFTVWYMRLAYPSETKEESKELVAKTIETIDGETKIYYWYDFEITDKLVVSGKTLSCSFEANYLKGALSTPLAGRGDNGDYVGFELDYHEKDAESHASDDVAKAKFKIKAGDYEIIYQQSNEFYIPSNASEGIIPKGDSLPSHLCNRVVLYNIAMDDVYEKKAQERLLDAAIDEIKRLGSDLNNYTVKSYPKYFYEHKNVLNIGQNVTYDDGNGYKLDTRILKLTTNLDYPCVVEITVGNQAIKGTITQLKEDVQSIVGSGSISGGGIYSVAQFNNLLRQYGERYFLSKTADDQAKGSIVFEKIQQFVEGLKLGGDTSKYSISSEGAAVLETISAERVHDSKSTIQDRVMTGAQGYDIYMGENGKSYAYIDNLIVRQKALFAETEIRKVSYAGGSVMYSNAGSTIVKVAYLFDSLGAVTAIKCYAKADDGTTKTANFWTVGMMALCKTFNVAEDNNRYYWRLVVGTGTEMLEDGLEYYYVVLSNVDMFEGSDKIIPTTGEGVFTEEKGNLLTWGDTDVMVAITQAGDNTSMADICGYDEDDEGTAIKRKTFYGYDVQTDGSNDLPAVGDVIVQVGDQIKWKSKGNLVAIRTSSEDEGSDDVPGITMYHSIGYPYLVDGYSWTYPYQWKTRVSVQSPEAWLVNANRFKFFTEDKESTAQTMASYIEATDEKISLKVNSDDLKATGIDITEKTITLTADKTKVRNNAGEEIAVFDADGTVTAGTLKTADTGGGSVEIKNGELAVKNPNGTTNILFGLTSDGYMALRYYDNEGNLLYDLGPCGLTARSITDKSWGVVEFAAVTNGTDYKQQYLWSNGTWNDSAPSASSSYSARQYYKAINNLQTAAFSEIEDETTHTKTSPEGTQPRWAANGYTKVTHYKYYAGKVNGTAVRDDDAGLTAAEAALADGKWFKQQTKLGNGDGTLNNAYIVEGTYLPYNGIVKAGLPDTSVGKYPTYRLTGMASFVWGSEQAEQEVVSEDITQ